MEAIGNPQRIYTKERSVDFEGVDSNLFPPTSNAFGGGSICRQL